VAKQAKTTKTPKTKKPKQVTRYTHEAPDPTTPETGHTSLIGEERMVTLSMDNGWTDAIQVGKLEGEDLPVVVDMHPAIDPILLWAGKRSRRDVPLLPLQRNEVVASSRIQRIVERARDAAVETSAGEPEQQAFSFGNLEKSLREAGKDKRVNFYTHDEGWKNKLICGDSLEVMESLIHYEGLRGKVQMIYIDPPYGIKYDSNFQQRIDSTKNNEKDKADDVLTIKAFRDTWTLGIHSYLSYLEERLYLCRELLADSGCLFVQINDENLHRIQLLLDEVLGASNYAATITFNKTTGFTSKALPRVFDCLLWYAKDLAQLKYHQLFQRKPIGLEGAGVYSRIEEQDGSRRRLTPDELENIDYLPEGARVYTLGDLTSQGGASELQPFEFNQRTYQPPANRHWTVAPDAMKRLAALGRIQESGQSLRVVRYYEDFPVWPLNNAWLDTGTGQFTDSKVYAVQTGNKVVERCVAMATDPGDVVFDPTCGSGTTAVVAEKLGRRWITCDTSRVAVNVARKRLLSSVFEHYKTRGDSPSSGFIFRTVDRVTLKSLAYDLEPERVELVDQPEPDKDSLRVTGPFEVMTLGRYSVQDWKGYVLEGDGQTEPENYVAVVSRLYKKDAALQDSAGVIHAVSEHEDGSLAISVGPISGRVTARQIHDAAQEAASSGLNAIHVLGWAFEANVGEVKEHLEKDFGIEIQLHMIRPDSLAEGLKVTQPEMLFSPLALPDIAIS
jgi:adenine-specific DNA-methyltransferase